MAVSDAVVRNLTMIYVAVIVAIKVYGVAIGQSFGGAFVLILSTAVVCLILFLTLTWDVSRKPAYAVPGDGNPPVAHESCKGGICWHGVAVRSSASDVRLRLPQQLSYGGFS